MGRAPCCDKANVKKGPWSPEEDEKLKTYIQQNGTGGNWIALPQKMGLRRCGKSCRLRWLNYLRPNLKHGGFTEQEDHIICSLYISIGSRWSIIAAQLPGRTDNDIKNYWNTRLKKKLMRGITRQSAAGTGQEELLISNSALERLAFSSSYYNNMNNPSLFNHRMLNPLQQPNLIKQEEEPIIMNSFPISDIMASDSGFTEAEIHDDLLNNNNNSSLTTGLDCFKGMELEGAAGSKDDHNINNLAWWSPTSWDYSEEIMYPNLGSIAAGYSMQ